MSCSCVPLLFLPSFLLILGRLLVSGVFALVLPVLWRPRFLVADFPPATGFAPSFFQYASRISRAPLRQGLAPKIAPSVQCSAKLTLDSPQSPRYGLPSSHSLSISRDSAFDPDKPMSKHGLWDDQTSKGSRTSSKSER